MIWRPLHIILARFGRASAAAAISRRWQRAGEAEPELAADLIRIGGVLALGAVDIVQTDNGSYAERVVPDPHVAAVEQGRRELALELLALMKVDPFDLSKMMEDEHVR